MVESSKSWWQVSSFNGVCKKVDRSAKYCAVVQNIVEEKDYWCAEYCGAVQNIIKKPKISGSCATYHQEVQNIGAVPGNQKQDSIN